MTIARARISLASSTISRPAWPARTFSTWPVTRRPPMSFACSMIASASRSRSGIRASIGDEDGTTIDTITWMPRRRRAASLTAVATASGS